MGTSQQPGDVFDLSEAARRVPGGDPQMIHELAQLLRDECGVRMAEIERAIDQQQATDLQRAAHTLKSAADLFGAKQVVRTASDIENMAKQGRLHEAGHRCEALRAEVQQLHEALQAYLKRVADQAGSA